MRGLQNCVREFVVFFCNLTFVCFEVQVFEVFFFFSLNHFVENNRSLFHFSRSTSMDDALHIHKQFFELQILDFRDFGF